MLAFTASAPEAAVIMSLSVERKIAAAFIFAVIVLAIIGAAAWWSLMRFERGFERVDHTYRVLNGIENVLVQALNVQSGSRGFALSADPAFLKPFDHGVREIRTGLDRVERLTADNPRQQATIRQLRPKIEELIGLLQHRNEEILAGHDGASRDAALLLSGKRAMDRVRDMIAEMVGRERELLSERVQMLGQESARTRGILMLAVAASLVFAAAAGTRVQRDLGDRRRVDAALARSQALFEALFEHATDALVVVDATGFIRRVNRRTEDLFFYQRAELIGRKVENLMPDRFRGVHVGHRQGFQAAPKFRAMGAGLELYARRKDGTEFPVDIMLSPLETEDGQVVLAAIRDITDRKAAAAELQRHSDELEAANEQLEAFSYSVSHDLRAPLRHMTGFATILAEHAGDKLDEESRRYLAVINRSAKKMNQLIDDLLAFAKLGRAPLTVSAVNMDELVRGLLEDGTIIAAPGTEWQIEPLPEVEGDRALLEQVWINLLGNAAKYSAKSQPPQIRVSVECGDHGRDVVFQVQDNGVGFDPAHADRLFNVFARLHTEQEFSGTGVGLALVKRIIMRHAGRVWAKSEPGRGATFCFALPRR